MICVYCGMALHLDQGVWVDDTEGDVCSGDDDLTNENEPHKIVTPDMDVPTVIEYTDGTKVTLPSLSEMLTDQAAALAEAKAMGLLDWGDE